MIDVIEFMVDTVMAGMARSGKYFMPIIPERILLKAFQNTVKMLIDNIKVIEDE